MRSRNSLSRQQQPQVMNRRTNKTRLGRSCSYVVPVSWRPYWWSFQELSALPLWLAYLSRWQGFCNSGIRKMSTSFGALHCISLCCPGKCLVLWMPCISSSHLSSGSFWKWAAPLREDSWHLMTSILRLKSRLPGFELHFTSRRDTVNLAGQRCWYLSTASSETRYQCFLCPIWYLLWLRWSLSFLCSFN